MAKTVLELSSIVRNGGGVSVDGRRFTTLELSSIARNAAGNNGRLVVRMADRFTPLELQSIARSGAGHVLFELDPEA